MGRKNKKNKNPSSECASKCKQNSKDNTNLLKPRYLILARDDPAETMIDLPTSLITNVINNVAGKVNSIKKQRNGTVLIETKSETQSVKLMKLKYFPPKVPVRVAAHKWLNYSKGVIKCRDAIKSLDLTIEDMKKELKNQSVVDVKPLLSKSLGKDGKSTLEKTSSYILTFSLPTLPKFVNIGYYIMTPTPYIPQPKMCYRCYKYGHITKYCKQEKQLCRICMKPEHKGENCNSSVCANCSQEHLTGHVSCLGYMVHRKIMEIDCILRNVNLNN